MQQRTTKATNMVGKLGQVGRISLLNVQKEKVGFFLLFLSSVLTGWSHFLILTADTAGFGEGIAECCPWASAALSFPAEADCCRSSMHTSALSLTAKSEKQMHHSCWGQQHNRLMKEGGSEEDDWGPYTEHQVKFLQRASGTTISPWSRITPRKWEDEM